MARAPPRWRRVGDCRLALLRGHGEEGSEQGLEEALRTLGIEEITISAKEGQKILPLPEGSSYLGFIFARGSSPQQVEDALRRAHKQLRFEIVPSLDVAPTHSSSEAATTAN